jgi:hypothetical protein
MHALPTSKRSVCFAISRSSRYLATAIAILAILATLPLIVWGFQSAVIILSAVVARELSSIWFLAGFAFFITPVIVAGFIFWAIRRLIHSGYFLIGLIVALTTLFLYGVVYWEISALDF